MITTLGSTERKQTSIIKQVNESLKEMLLIKRLEKAYYTIDDVAYLLGYQKSYIYKMTNKRTIPHRKLNGKIIFLKSEIDAWIKSKPLLFRGTI